jgi:hypothetical protein
LRRKPESSKNKLCTIPKFLRISRCDCVFKNKTHLQEPHSDKIMRLSHLFLGGALFAQSCLAADALSLVTAANIEKLAPLSKSCSGGEFAHECTDSQRAAALLASSFRNFGTTSATEVALLTANMVGESGQFKFFHHHYGSPNPGQGTYNMMGPKYVLQYAQSLPSLRTQLDAITGGSASPPPEQMDAVLDMLHANGADFQSAPWFVVTQCPEVRAALADPLEVFEAHCKCLGVDGSEVIMGPKTRLQLFQDAGAVFGVKF